MGVWLVLSEPDDSAAHWAYRRLLDGGLAPLELVSSHALVHAPRSAHRVDRDGGAGFEIDLPDGRTLASGDIRGVLNRLTWAPVGDIVFATRADTSYARQELSALVLSWLASVAPVMVNRPATRGLSGDLRSPAEWTALAAGAGLPVAPVRLGSRSVGCPDSDLTVHSVVVLGERVFGGGAVEELAPACVRLARLAGVELLGVDLRLGDRPPGVFAGATVLPDLRTGGNALVEALHQRLTGSSVAESA